MTIEDSPDGLWCHSEPAGDVCDPGLDDEESLGPTEAPEGGVRGEIGLAAVALHPQVRHLATQSRHFICID
jgi:hypothetical protein